MRSDWPEVTMMVAITGDTIRRHKRPFVPRTGEIVVVDPELSRWRVVDVVHDGDCPDRVLVYPIPILAVPEVSNGDN